MLPPSLSLSGQGMGCQQLVDYPDFPPRPQSPRRCCENGPRRSCTTTAAIFLHLLDLAGRSGKSASPGWEILGLVVVYPHLPPAHHPAADVSKLQGVNPPVEPLAQFCGALHPYPVHVQVGRSVQVSRYPGSPGTPVPAGGMSAPATGRSPHFSRPPVGRFFSGGTWWLGGGRRLAPGGILHNGHCIGAPMAKPWA